MLSTTSSIVAIIGAAIVTIYDTTSFRRRLRHSGTRWQRIVIYARCSFLWIVTIASLVNAISSHYEGETNAKLMAYLESRLARRIITPEQRKTFTDTLVLCPRGPLKIGTSRPNMETIAFVNQVGDMLTDAGFTVTKKDYLDQFPVFPEGIYITLIIHTPEDAPPCTDFIRHAFDSIGIKTALNRDQPEHPLVEPGSLLIFITENR